ncbi:MAG: 1-(5-phosphoribosyl)-5-[(5-phosphoribosylamino)methylideneamino]imidazole-4-carboxamide isomerase [Bacteroidota bacterium]
MRIIPAIDIIEGKAVRLREGDYQQKTVYHDDPAEVAKSFEDAGLQYVHVVDLDGAKSSKVINAKALESISKSTNLQIDFGGGIKSQSDIDLVFGLGIAQVTCGSLAVSNSDLVKSWIKDYGSERIILGADVRDKMIATRGWLDQSQISIDAILNEYASYDLEYSIVTDIHRDGVGAGPSLDLYTELVNAFPQIKFIASGGIHSLADLDRLKHIGMDGAIIGRAIYENEISLSELKAYVD